MKQENEREYTVCVHVPGRQAVRADLDFTGTKEECVEEARRRSFFAVTWSVIALDNLEDY